MATLPQPNLKSEGKKKLTLVQRMRGASNYRPKRITGYAPFPHAALAEAARLADGVGFKLLVFLLDQSLGRMVKDTDPFMESTESLKITTMAEFCRCDERTIQRELGGLEFRKVVSLERAGKGAYIVSPLFRTWDQLPDYKAGPVEEPEEDSDAEPPAEDPAKNKETTRLTLKPVFVSAGKRSKPLPVSCGVAAIQFHSDIDAQWSAVVQGGTLLVSLQQKWQAKDGVTVPNGINKLDSGTRHQRRVAEPEAGGQSKPEGGRGSQSRRSPASIHPRAEELSSLFDPLVHKWCGKTLSGDESILLKACQAIGETPHDVVVKQVIDRASRALKPLHVEYICREIEHNWIKTKDLPAAKRIPTWDEVQGAIAKERAERLAKQKGRVA